LEKGGERKVEKVGRARMGGAENGGAENGEEGGRRGGKGLLEKEK